MLPMLKQLRRMVGISQQRLADALEISQQSINQYENHNIEPDIMTMSKMADYFGTSIDYIVGRTDVKTPFVPASTYSVNSDESVVLTKYRALTPKERACVSQVIDTLLEK